VHDLHHRGLRHCDVTFTILLGMFGKSSYVLSLEMTFVNKGALNFSTPKFPKYFGFLFFFYFLTPLQLAALFCFNYVLLSIFNGCQ